VEGWTPEHDDEHVDSELGYAAAAYLYIGNELSRGMLFCNLRDFVRGMYWPWGKRWWKPSEDPVRNLVKAGALIAAEIDRLQRRDS
jgi:hypothetical protein